MFTQRSCSLPTGLPLLNCKYDPCSIFVNDELCETPPSKRTVLLWDFTEVIMGCLFQTMLSLLLSLFYFYTSLIYVNWIKYVYFRLLTNNIHNTREHDCMIIIYRIMSLLSCMTGVCVLFACCLLSNMYIWLLEYMCYYVHYASNYNLHL